MRPYRAQSGNISVAHLPSRPYRKFQRTVTTIVYMARIWSSPLRSHPVLNCASEFVSSEHVRLDEGTAASRPNLRETPCLRLIPANWPALQFSIKSERSPI